MKKPYQSTISLTRLPLSAIAIAVAAATAPSAMAQGSEAALEEVIVTARKRDESMQKVPVSVTAISADLVNASIRNLQDLEGFAPNVTIDQNGAGPGASTFSIRGVSYQEIDKSSDPSIGVVLDGVYMGTNVGQLLTNFDIERVEVLRGPQGTLFGKNTLGGVVNVIRNKPRGELGGELRLGTGSNDLRDVKGVLHFPIVKDKLAAKVYGTYIKSDGWQENTTLNIDTAALDSKTYGFSLLGNPTENFEIQFTYDRIEDESDMTGNTNRNQPDDLICAAAFGALGPPMWTPSDACEAFDTGSDEDHVSQERNQDASLETDAVTLRMEWDIGPGYLTSITGYRENEEYRLSDYDGSGVAFITIQTYQDYEQTSQELNFTSTFSDTIDFVAGLYYWNSEYSQRGTTDDLWQILAGLPPGAYGQLSQSQETESYAAYFQGDWHINDAWTATLGLRYTKEKKDFYAESQNYYLEDGTELTPFETGVQDDEWEETTPKLGLSYQLNDDVMLFAGYAKGFKSGGFFGRNSDLSNILPYDPEYMDLYELGAKTEWLDNRLRFNATVFYQEYTDKQEENLVQLPDGNVSTIVTNAGEVEIPGVELELVAALTDNLRLRASYGYLDADYKEYIGDTNGDGVETDNSDRTPRRSPKNTFGASATYNRTVGQGEFIGDVTYRWRDEYETIANNDPLGHVDSFGLWSASIDYIYKENYQLSLYGRNLSDERYKGTVRIGGLSTFGTYNQGRNWGLEFRYMM